MPALLSVIALVVAMLALVLATLANRRWARRGGASGSPAPQAAELEQMVTQAVQRALRPSQTTAPEPPEQSGANALQHVAVVRYDAFGDVGGRLSYSVAILDDTGSGLVLSTLSGKADVRTYVKTISGGQPDQVLTPEEQQAVTAAGRSPK